MKAAASERHWPKLSTKGAINSIHFGSGNTSTPSTRPYIPFSGRLKHVSCSTAAIRPVRKQLALQALENLREQQASALAYFDCSGCWRR